MDHWLNLEKKGRFHETEDWQPVSISAYPVDPQMLMLLRERRKFTIKAADDLFNGATRPIKSSARRYFAEIFTSNLESNRSMIKCIETYNLIQSAVQWAKKKAPQNTGALLLKFTQQMAISVPDLVERLLVMFAVAIIQTHDVDTFRRMFVGDQSVVAQLVWPPTKKRKSRFVIEDVIAGIKLHNHPMDADISIVDEIAISRQPKSDATNELIAVLMRDFGVGITHPKTLAPAILERSPYTSYRRRLGYNWYAIERDEISQVFIPEITKRVFAERCPYLMKVYDGKGKDSEEYMLQQTTASKMAEIHIRRCAVIRDVLIGKPDEPQILPNVIFDIIIKMCTASPSSPSSNGESVCQCINSPPIKTHT